MVWFLLAVTAIVWAVCGVLAYGLTLGHFQRKFPSLAKEHRNSDISHAIFTGLFGPIGLLSIIGIAKHGFMWRAPK